MFGSTLLQRHSASVMHIFRTSCAETGVGATDPKLIVAAMRTVPAMTHFPPGLLPLIASFLGPDSIFVAGGYCGKSRLHTTSLCYSLNTHRWRTNVAAMSEARTNMATAAFGGRMMVFGGRIADPLSTVLMVTATCEAFDPSINTWSALPSMPTPRSSAVAVAWQDRVFVFGGCLPWLPYDLSSACCFHPLQNGWSAISPMTCCRRLAAAVAIPSLGILVMGGHSGWETLESVELYDPNIDKWTTMPWLLPKPLCNFAAHFLDDGMLYIIGGSSGSGKNTDCWSMDLSAAVPVWSPLPSLPGAMEGLASVAV